MLPLLNAIKRGGILPQLNKIEKKFLRAARVYKLHPGELAPRGVPYDKQYSHEEEINWQKIKDNGGIGSLVDKMSADAYDNLVAQIMADRPGPRSRFYMRSSFTIEQMKNPKAMADLFAYWMSGSWGPIRKYTRVVGRFFERIDDKTGAPSMLKWIRVVGGNGKDLTTIDVHNGRNTATISRYKLNKHYKVHNV